MVDTIFLLSPSIRATLPSSRRVTENMFSRLSLFSFLVGRFSGGTMTFQVAFISFRPYSGGVGRLVLQEARHQVDVLLGQFARGLPSFGMPPGEP
jgi:hypothetical protein